jgi:hypothetical protein
MFLSFFRLSTLTFEVGECHIQRIGAEADSDDLPNCRLSGGIRTEFNQPKRVLGTNPRGTTSGQPITHPRTLIGCHWRRLV